MRKVLNTTRIVAGFGLLAVAIGAFATAGGAITAGHWSYRAFYLVAALTGTLGIIVARRAGTAPPTWRGLVVALGLVIAIGIAWFLIPFEAQADAVTAMESDQSVLVEDSGRQIVMRPSGAERATGLIFHPGARVDARAYVAILRPIAAAGHPVVIVKQPLGIAFLASGFAPSWATEHPETQRWVLGGHSLGGVVAAQNASAVDAIDGLILWASLPASDISGDGLEVLSIYGTADGLAAAAEIEGSRATLPPATMFVRIEGAIHSHFASYGPQPGDGQATISAEAAQGQITAATLEFMSR